jgi:hypothetical protein
LGTEYVIFFSNTQESCEPLYEEEEKKGQEPQESTKRHTTPIPTLLTGHYKGQPTHNQKTALIVASLRLE